MYEAPTMGARHVRGSYKGCEVCARQLQGMQGMCEAATMSARHVRGSYKGCEAATRGARHV